MRHSEDLFKLIKSLSKSEKRHFKLLSSLQKGDKNYVRLFNAIEKQEEYREEKIKQLFATEKFIKRLPVAKAYLYTLILKSLHSYHSNTDSQLKELLHWVNILFEKKLFGQCEKILMKAKKIAYKYEKYPVLFEIFEWEDQIMFTRGNMEGIKRYLEYGINEEKNAARVYDNILAYKALRAKIFLASREMNIVRSKGQEKKFEEIIAGPLLSDEKEALSLNAKINFHYIHSIYHRYQENFKQGYFSRKKLISLFESQPYLILERPDKYIAYIHNLILFLCIYNKPDGLTELLDKLKTVSTHPAVLKRRDLEVILFKFIYRAELNVYLITAQFEKGIGLTDKIEKGVKQHENLMEKAYSVDFYHKLSYFHFILGNYSKALYFLNKILNDPSFPKWEDLFFYIRIFNLILHFELGNQDTLDYYIRSASRFLNKREKLYRFETILLHFLKKAIPNLDNPAGLNENFRNLKKELKEIKQENYGETALIEYFDYISWLESKIENRPFEEILREKAGKKK